VNRKRSGAGLTPMDAKTPSRRSSNVCVLAAGVEVADDPANPGWASEPTVAGYVFDDGAAVAPSPPSTAAAFGVPG
jgi:hypothetical protein